MKNLDVTLLKIGKTLKRRFFLITSIFILIIGTFSIFSIKGLFKVQNAIFMEYPEILSHNSINGKIKKVILNRGAILIELDNCKFHVKPTRNYLYTPFYLDEFLQLNDSLIKNPNSDTLYIYRNSDKYYFIINKFINKSK